MRGVRWSRRRPGERGRCDRALALPHTIRSVSTGSRNRRCVEAGLPEPEFEAGAGFVTRIWRKAETTRKTERTTQKSASTTSITTPKTGQTTPITTPKTVPERILALLAAEPRMTRKQLAERVGCHAGWNRVPHAPPEGIRGDCSSRIAASRPLAGDGPRGARPMTAGRGLGPRHPPDPRAVPRIWQPDAALDSGTRRRALPALRVFRSLQDCRRGDASGRG